MSNMIYWFDGVFAEQDQPAEAQQLLKARHEIMWKVHAFWFVRPSEEELARIRAMAQEMEELFLTGEWANISEELGFPLDFPREGRDERAKRRWLSILVPYEEKITAERFHDGRGVRSEAV